MNSTCQPDEARWLLPLKRHQKLLAGGLIGDGAVKEPQDAAQLAALAVDMAED
jgi:hypothetical protein